MEFAYEVNEMDRYHLETWQQMLEEIDALGWKKVPLRDAEGFTSQLIFLPKLNPEKKNGIFIVCAGGGFNIKAQHEAKPVAEFFRSQGIDTAILDYHVREANPAVDGDEMRKQAMLDGMAAVRYCRYHAEELGIDPEKIAIGGFSAGGITTSLTATHADDGDPTAEDPMLRVSSRPNAALLLYGAFSNVDKLWTVGGYNIEAQRQMAMLDPIANIGPMMPPTFIFQTHGDDPRIGLSFAMELARRGVPFEIHTFEEGGHGGALFDGNDKEAPNIPHTAKWADLAADWLRMRGFMQ